MSLALHFSEGFAFLCFVFFLFFVSFLLLSVCAFGCWFCFVLFFVFFFLLIILFVSSQSHSVLSVCFNHACFYVMFKRNPLLQLL